MVQELLGRAFPPIARTGSWTSTLVTSGLIVGAWGYFLYQGVLDPLGGINSLWPLFGISNQILASVALVVATTILIKMGRTRHVWVTLVPTAWLVTVTLTGSWQKVFHEDPRLGFLAQARSLEQQLADGRVPEARAGDARHVVFNNRLDAAVTGFFALLILALLVEAATEWYRILTGRKGTLLTETPYVRTKWAEGAP
jgi:carbon starvation protein